MAKVLLLNIIFILFNSIQNPSTVVYGNNLDGLPCDLIGDKIFGGLLSGLWDISNDMLNVISESINIALTFCGRKMAFCQMESLQSVDFWKARNNIIKGEHIIVYVGANT